MTRISDASHLTRDQSCQGGIALGGVHEMNSSAIQPHPALNTITTAEDIANLAGDIRFFTSRKRKIRVELGGLSPDENRTLEATINGFYSACGCGQGRISGVITLVGYLTLVFTGVISVAALGIGKTILLYLACATMAMIVAKAFALSKARRSLIALSEQFQAKEITADISQGG